MDLNHLIQGIEPANEIVKWHCREYSNSELFHIFFKRKFFDRQKSLNRKKKFIMQLQRLKVFLK